MTAAEPTPADWAALQASIAAAMFGVFQQGLAAPPAADLAEEAAMAGVAALAEHRAALRTEVEAWLEHFDGNKLWPEVVVHVHAMLDGVARSLAVVAAHREAHPELAAHFLAAIDAEDEVWGRLVRNLAGGLMYVAQENEDPMILRQFVFQATGISGIRPTPTEDGRLRVDVSPEPPFKLAQFFGV